MYCLNFRCCFSTHILLDLRTGLLITGILLGEYRNFFLPLDSTDSLLTKLSLVMLFSLRTRECRNNFCTNLPYLLYLCQYLIIPKDNINSGTEQKFKKKYMENQIWFLYGQLALALWISCSKFYMVIVDIVV